MWLHACAEKRSFRTTFERLQLVLCFIHCHWVVAKTTSSKLNVSRTTKSLRLQPTPTNPYLDASPIFSEPANSVQQVWFGVHLLFTHVNLGRIQFDKPVLDSSDFSFHLQNRNRFGSNRATRFRNGLLHETSNEYMQIFLLTNCCIISSWILCYQYFCI